MIQRNNAISGLAVLMAATLFSTFAQARSMLYYIDFDTVTDGALVYTGVNKGTGTAELEFKQDGSDPLGFIEGGALGSSHAFYSSSNSSLWLGGDSASLDCGTERGFTISFWCRLSASHTAYRDFFGFRVGGKNYRLEYTDADSTTFTLYEDSCVLRKPETDESYSHSGEPANIWQHFAIVATPNGTNALGTCAFFIDGKKIAANVVLKAAGDLQQLYIGSLVRAANGKNRKGGISGTGIDELAVFDYPATVEQLKWLAKFRPAQPANGPAREMPYCWHFDTTNESFGATAKVNSGTGKNVAYLYGDEDPIGVKSSTYITAPTEDAAMDTAYAMRAADRATWRVDDEVGLGPTVGSGFTISFWMRGNEQPYPWSDFFTFNVGGRYLRYEFGDQNPANIYIYNGSPALGAFARDVNIWQHYCAVWNNATQQIDFYVDGVLKGSAGYSVMPDQSDAVKVIMAGRQSFEYDKSGNAKWRKINGNGDNEVYLDEVALFNHSFSPEQIKWLASNVPCLPALDATNLVRAVAANDSWSGGLASWGVREWDAESGTWTQTARTTIYPALEDTEVDVEVTLAGGVTLANDTFVTPKHLVFKAEAGASVSATFDCAEGSMFDPATFELGEGVNLSVAAGAIAMKTGTIKFNEGSAIKVDCSGIEQEWTEVLSASDFTLPEGSGNVLDHVKAQKGRYAFMVDGNRIMCKKVYGLMIIFK